MADLQTTQYVIVPNDLSHVQISANDQIGANDEANRLCQLIDDNYVIISKMNTREAVHYILRPGRDLDAYKSFRSKQELAEV